jgi:hypothetical protein
MGMYRFSAMTRESPAEGLAAGDFIFHIRSYRVWLYLSDSERQKQSSGTGFL